MSPTDWIRTRAQAKAIREISRGIAAAIQSPDPNVRGDALTFAREIYPPQPSLLDIMRVSRGMAPADDG